MSNQTKYRPPHDKTKTIRVPREIASQVAHFAKKLAKNNIECRSSDGQTFIYTSEEVKDSDQESFARRETQLSHRAAPLNQDLCTDMNQSSKPPTEVEGAQSLRDEEESQDFYEYNVDEIIDPIFAKPPVIVETAIPPESVIEIEASTDRAGGEAKCSDADLLLEADEASELILAVETEIEPADSEIEASDIEIEPTPVLIPEVQEIPTVEESGILDSEFMEGYEEIAEPAVEPSEGEAPEQEEEKEGRRGKEQKEESAPGVVLDVPDGVTAVPDESSAAVANETDHRQVRFDVAEDQKKLLQRVLAKLEAAEAELKAIRSGVSVAEEYDLRTQSYLEELEHPSLELEQPEPEIAQVPAQSQSGIDVPGLAVASSDIAAEAPIIDGLSQVHTPDDLGKLQMDKLIIQASVLSEDKVFAETLFKVWKELASQKGLEIWGVPIELGDIYNAGFTHLMSMSFLGKLHQTRNLETDWSGRVQFITGEGFTYTVGRQEVRWITFKKPMPLSTAPFVPAVVASNQEFMAIGVPPSKVNLDDLNPAQSTESPTEDVAAMLRRRQERRTQVQQPLTQLQVEALGIEGKDEELVSAPEQKGAPRLLGKLLNLLKR